MNSLLNQVLAILAPRHMEYLVLDEGLKILEISRGAGQFADFPHEVLPGKDIRLGFPEFVGLEEALNAIAQGKQSCFQLKGICRSSDSSSSLYIDIHALVSQNNSNSQYQLIILFEDVTEKMVSQQRLVQSANEANLLLSVISASQQYIYKVLQSIGDALLVTTLSGKIKTLNQAAIDLFGFKEDELINKPISMIIADEQFLSQVGHQHESHHSEILKNIEVICKTKTGQNIPVAFSCSAIHNDIQEELDLVYIGRDITLAKRAEAEIRQALAKEKELNEFKSRFVSMVSHEFGNPLNRVLMSAELLENFSDRSTETEKRQYIQHIRAATKQMVHLLKDVLTIGKVEAGKLEFHPAPLDLKKFCFELVEETKIAASEKHTITCRCDNFSFLPLMDENLLQHMLANLLANAVKYSPGGGNIQLEVFCQNDKVIFQIKDEGIGIPLAEQKQLFESFYRAKNVGKIPGTGLGLAIVKQCVDLHGGQIEIASNVNRGTTFTIAIPLTQECLNQEAT